MTTATDDEPLLLTPGPLTTSLATRRAMLRDWGSRDRRFIALTRQIRARLVGIVDGDEAVTAVPIQGSGTFAIEATIGTLVPPSGKLLVLVNGAYGRRMAAITRRLGRACAVAEGPEDMVLEPSALARALARDSAVSHVAVVHCETTSGLLNPLAPIAETVARADRRLIVDAMSSFGALPIDMRAPAIDAVVASANKCLEGVPGLAFSVMRRDALAQAHGRAPSLSLDLHDQWQVLERTGEWRFTPPTHVVAALAQALDEHEREGGVAGRGARYRDNHRALVAGMRALGFETFLPDTLQTPIIVTFRQPADPRYDFRALYDGMAARGFLIYPGKLTAAPSFRIGCIGRLGEAEITAAVGAVAACLADMGVASGAPSESG